MIEKIGVFFFLPLLWEWISSSFLLYLWFPLSHLHIFSFLMVSLFWEGKPSTLDSLLILLIGITSDLLLFSPWGAYLFILSSLALFTYLWVKFFSTSFVSLSVIFFCLPLLELGLEWVVAALGETTLPFLPLLGAKLLSIPLNIFLFYWWQKRETRRGLEYVE